MRRATSTASCLNVDGPIWGVGGGGGGEGDVISSSSSSQQFVVSLLITCLLVIPVTLSFSSNCTNTVPPTMKYIDLPG